VAARAKALIEAGAPEGLARQAAVLEPLTTAADLVDLAEASSWPLANVARLYHAAGEAFGFDRVRQAAGAYAVGDQFERTALRRLIEELLSHQAELTRGLMAFAGSAQAGENAEKARETTASWSVLRREKADLSRRTIGEIEAAGGAWTFAKLTIANAALRELAEAVRKR
jgi:glutamate dehydrogenase